MRKLISISILLIAISFSCDEKKNINESLLENKNSKWYTIKYETRNVEFQFPKNQYIKSNDTAVVDWLGNVELETFRLVYKQPDSSGNLGYSFSHYKYPNHKFEENEITPFFDGIVENLKDAFNAQIIYNKKIQYNGYPGREIYYLIPNQKVYFTERTYLIDGEQYVMSVLTDKNRLIDSSIKKFFDSFQILD